VRQLLKASLSYKVAAIKLTHKFPASWHPGRQWLHQPTHSLHHPIRVPPPARVLHQPPMAELLPEVPEEPPMPELLPEVPEEPPMPELLPEVPEESPMPELLPEVPEESPMPELLPEVPEDFVRQVRRRLRRIPPADPGAQPELPPTSRENMREDCRSEVRRLLRRVDQVGQLVSQRLGTMEINSENVDERFVREMILIKAQMKYIKISVAVCNCLTDLAQASDGLA
jgi:hypothetical protein